MSLGCACSAGRRWPGYDALPGVQVTVLVENRPGLVCRAAHGLALWIEAGDRILLLDTGPDPHLLEANARALGLDLGRVETVVLSHGHDDHTGGLPAVVAARCGRPLAVIMHPAATQRRFSSSGGRPRSIGMPAASLAALTAPGVTLVPSAQPTTIAAGIWVTGATPRRGGVPREPCLSLDAAGLVEDPLEDDQALVIDTVHGLVVLCGCAHAGLPGLLAFLDELRPDAPIALLAGGLHLRSVEAPALACLAAELARRQPTRLAPGH